MHVHTLVFTCTKKYMAWNTDLGALEVVGFWLWELYHPLVRFDITHKDAMFWLNLRHFSIKMRSKVIFKWKVCTVEGLLCHLLLFVLWTYSSLRCFGSCCTVVVHFTKITLAYIHKIMSWLKGALDKYNMCLFISSSIEDLKPNQYRKFQLILPMPFHFMRYFVNSIIFRVPHRLLYCVFIEVDFEK